MDAEEVSLQFSKKGISFDDPSFYQHAFTLVSQERKKEYLREPDNFKRTIVEEFDGITRRLDQTKIQESTQVRHVLRTKRLANLLISDAGDLNTAILPSLIAFLKEHLYSLGPDRQYDAKRQEHLLDTLTLLNESKEIKRAIKSIDKPVFHKYAEQIIRDTLQMLPNETLTDAHTRRAALSAWMCLLRQNVGSCFATAPAIIIQSEQPELFFKDIAEILNTGQLKRTFGGIEYSVPLSYSWGAGDLKKPFILPLGESFNASALWISPGLEAAFLAADLLDREDTPEINAEKIKTLLLGAIASYPKAQPYAITTAEALIRTILLKALGITEKDVTEYENRPRGMIYGGLLMQPTSVTAKKSDKDALKGKSKGELSEIFLAKLAKGENAFKALADNALLKAWEFTIASFAETKAGFTRWNLYSSLGLGPNEAGGIGAVFFENIRQRVERYNEKVQELQYEYEHLFAQLKTIEMRMQSASEREAQWIKMEYQTKRNEFHTLEEMRGQARFKAERFANLFDSLIDAYDTLFPKYFQEVYDADMHDVTAGPYDDSPAGFRLLYKYGRSNTSQWTRIKTPTEFIEDLAAFFTSTENELASTKGFEGIESDLSAMITDVVTHIRTKEFLETAFFRMAKAHQMPIIKDPLDHLDNIEKKPWAYTSGGTMGTLVSCYYKREQKPTEASRWMESPIELLVFLVDTLKQVPHNLMEPYLKDPKKSMLMHSPTHAFLLKPGAPLLKQAWQTDAFTYTWVRDNIVLPQQKMVETLWLGEKVMHTLVERLAASVPEDFRHYFKKVFGNIYGDMRPYEFRHHLLDGIQKERGLRQAGQPILSSDEIDSALYSLLPLFPRHELAEKLKQLFSAIPSIDEAFCKELMKFYDQLEIPRSMESHITSLTLQTIAKALLNLTTNKTSFATDYHAAVSLAAQTLGLAMPQPFIFADTNWVKEEFGLLVNPGSGNFELWRVDKTGSCGHPMSNWKQWLDGSRKDIPWGVYNRPYEYGG